MRGRADRESLYRLDTRYKPTPERNARVFIESVAAHRQTITVELVGKRGFEVESEGENLFYRRHTQTWNKGPENILVVHRAREAHLLVAFNLAGISQTVVAKRFNFAQT